MVPPTLFIRIRENAGREGVVVRVNLIADGRVVIVNFKSTSLLLCHIFVAGREEKDEMNDHFWRRPCTRTSPSLMRLSVLGRRKSVVEEDIKKQRTVREANIAAKELTRPRKNYGKTHIYSSP